MDVVSANTTSECQMKPAALDEPCPSDDHQGSVEQTSTSSRKNRRVVDHATLDGQGPAPPPLLRRQRCLSAIDESPPMTSEISTPVAPTLLNDYADNAPKTDVAAAATSTAADGGGRRQQHELESNTDQPPPLEQQQKNGASRRDQQDPVSNAGGAKKTVKINENKASRRTEKERHAAASVSAAEKKKTTTSRNQVAARGGRQHLPGSVMGGRRRCTGHRSRASHRDSECSAGSEARASRLGGCARGGHHAQTVSCTDLRSLRARGESGAATHPRSCSLMNTARNCSIEMVDLHVYMIPRDKWSQARHLAEKSSRFDTISLGFVRVQEDSSLMSLRRDIASQLFGDSLALNDYKFVRAVGKHFAEVKTNQEVRLKAKNFLPPYTSDPEIHLLRSSIYDDATRLQRSHCVDHDRRPHGRRLERNLGGRHIDYSLTRAALKDLRERYDRVRKLRERRDKEKDKLMSISKELQEELARRKHEECEKWRRLYQNECRLTRSLEEACSSLRQDVENGHERLMQRVRTRAKGSFREGPSRKLTLKMNIHRAEEEISDWERRRQTCQMMLNTEIMLRSQAEKNVKELRKELGQKSVNVNNLRSRYGHEAAEIMLLLGRPRVHHNQKHC